MTILIYLSLFVLGSALGSFAMASVWRLRARQLAYDQKHHEKLTAAEKRQLHDLQPLIQKKGKPDRSQCLHCHRQLTPIDLIPVLSWIALRGKCRTCHARIGMAEFLCEIGLGIVLVVSYAVWPHQLDGVAGIALFCTWIAALVLLTIHIAYDSRWFLLLDGVTIILAVVAAIFVVLRYILIPIPLLALFQELMLALLVLPGLYGLMYLISHGRWIGLGDVKLLVPLAMMLGGWQQAILMLFLANLVGCIWILPGMITKKLTRTSRIPFGPFLIVGWAIAMLFGVSIIQWYTGGLVVL